MTPLPNPFEFHAGPGNGCGTVAAPDLTDHPDAATESRFILDEDAFLADLDPLPAFLVSPSQQYLKAADLIPVLETLAGR